MRWIINACLVVIYRLWLMTLGTHPQYCSHQDCFISVLHSFKNYLPTCKLIVWMLILPCFWAPWWLENWMTHYEAGTGESLNSYQHINLGTIPAFMCLCGKSKGAACNWLCQQFANHMAWWSQPAIPCLAQSTWWQVTVSISHGLIFTAIPCLAVTWLDDCSLALQSHSLMIAAIPCLAVTWLDDCSLALQSHGLIIAAIPCLAQSHGLMIATLPCSHIAWWSQPYPALHGHMAWWLQPCLAVT